MKPNPINTPQKNTPPSIQPPYSFNKFRIMHVLLPCDEDGNLTGRLYLNVNQFLQEHPFSNYHDGYIIVDDESGQPVTLTVYETPAEAGVAIMDNLLDKELDTLATFMAKTRNIQQIEKLIKTEMPNEWMDELIFIIKKTLATMPEEQYQELKNSIIISPKGDAQK